jgi:hypothetical protein
MYDAHVIWDLPDEPDGNIAHIAEHGFTPEDIEDVLFDPESETAISRSSGHQITFGHTADGRYIAVVWEHVMDDPLTMRPITAYEVDEPRI